MSSHDELNRAIGIALDGMHTEIAELKWELLGRTGERNGLLFEQNTIRSIIAGSQSPEHKLEQIKTLLKTS